MSIVRSLWKTIPNMTIGFELLFMRLLKFEWLFLVHTCKFITFKRRHCENEGYGNYNHCFFEVGKLIEWKEKSCCGVTMQSAVNRYQPVITHTKRHGSQASSRSSIWILFISWQNDDCCIVAKATKFNLTTQFIKL